MSDANAIATTKEPGRKSLWALCIWCLLVLLCVWVWTPALTYGLKNTLEKNGRWRVGKMELADELMGARPFYARHQAIAAQFLNLGAWHGFQRVILKDALPAQSLEFEYCFPIKDYLLVLLNYSDDGFDALKIPSIPEESATLSHVKYTGEYLSTQAFPLPGRKLDIWNTARLTLETDRVGLSVNGGPEVWLNLHMKTEQNFGFQSGINGVLLDNIAIRGTYGQSLFRETFDNEHIRSAVLRWLILAVIGGNLILGIAMRFFGLSTTAILSNLIAVQISFIAGGFVISQFYVPALASKYPGMSISIKEMEEKWIAENSIKVFSELQARYPTKAEADTLRIAVVGTSQTFGIGATLENEGLVEQLERILNNTNDSYCRYECVNFGFSGSWSKPLFENFEKLSPAMAPDVCIINLANNDDLDERSDIFADNLRNFVEYNREHGIETVFVKEALCAEALPGDFNNHITMQAVADELGVPVVESHRILGEHLNKGLLWWDFVHPTSFGHSLIAKAIADSLQRDVLPKLCEEIKAASSESAQ